MMTFIIGLIVGALLKEVLLRIVKRVDDWSKEW